MKERLVTLFYEAIGEALKCWRDGDVAQGQRWTKLVYRLRVLLEHEPFKVDLTDLPDVL